MKPIRNDEDHKNALREIERLWNAEPGTDEGDRFEVLSVLVDAYERERHPIPQDLSETEAMALANEAVWWARSEKRREQLVRLKKLAREFFEAQWAKIEHDLWCDKGGKYDHKTQERALTAFCELRDAVFTPEELDQSAAESRARDEKFDEDHGLPDDVLDPKRGEAIHWTPEHGFEGGDKGECPLCKDMEARGPNTDTLQAMQELAEGSGQRFSTVEELMASLHGDDEEA